MNVTDDPSVRALYDLLDINLWSQQPIFSRYIGAAQPVSIVRETSLGRQLNNATWWLLLEETESGFRPSKYTSFNTRYDKLSTPRSAGFIPYRQSRCIIAAKGFGESEFKNGKRISCHDMQAKDDAIAFGGLYREWLHRGTGEIPLSCSVITLPPNPKLSDIHSKSIPLMLPQDKATLDAWLAPNNTETKQFEPLLEPVLRHDLIVQQIEKPSAWNKHIGEPFIIEKDS
ncbi:SOS response-associated peptidase family protein [Paraneptunicella aestuarii]|uniref:SOS response-associated peptidase family protein n=1 Tax=Paraneptunicella aestuarii TaxID=2831148 RepID=UPI002FC9FFCC